MSLEVSKNKFVIYQLGMALVELVPSEGKGGLDNSCRLLSKRCAPKKHLFKGLFFGGPFLRPPSKPLDYFVLQSERVSKYEN